MRNKEVNIIQGPVNLFEERKKKPFELRPDQTVQRLTIHFKKCMLHKEINIIVRGIGRPANWYLARLESRREAGKGRTEDTLLICPFDKPRPGSVPKQGGNLRRGFPGQGGTRNLTADNQDPTCSPRPDVTVGQFERRQGTEASCVYVHRTAAAVGQTKPPMKERGSARYQLLGYSCS